MQVQQFLEDSVHRFPDKTALVSAGRRMSYLDIERAANAIAHSLIRNGIRRGDRVVVYLGNSAECAAAIFAILKAGAIFTVLSPKTKAERLTYILNNCLAAGVITDLPRLHVIEGCHDQLPSSLTAVWVDSEHVPVLDGLRLISLQEVLDWNQGADSPPANNSIDLDLAALIYTSGSTGKPKGVMVTHCNVLAAANSITTFLENTSSDIILNVLPLSFNYGLYQLLMAFKIGGTLVLDKSFTYPQAVVDTLIREHVTGLPIVPTISAILLQLNLTQYSFPDLRYITNTAAALPTRHIAGLREAFPAAKIYSMYGLTECKRVSYLPPDQIEIRPTSVGRGMPNEEVYLVDDDGCRVGPGGIGELVVRGSNVTRGYWDDPDETDKIFRPGPIYGEKVLYTGDLFKADEEGYLYFLGRKDDMIKTRGEKVSPTEVEEVLYVLEGVAEAAVIGVPDPILGNAIKAIVSLREGTTLTEREILSHCAARLEDFMVPKYVEFIQSLPKTSTGKISRRELAMAGGTL
jgi:long-chain acyl-CoA synthetase